MSLKDKQFIFGPFNLDPANRRLVRDQKATPLAPKAFDTLLYLVENSPRLVSREELLARIWPDSVVEDANLTVNISLLRKALGNRSDGHPYIETVPTKGYRFDAEVKTIEQNTDHQLPATMPRLQQEMLPEISAALPRLAKAKRISRRQHHFAFTAAGGLTLLAVAAGWLVLRPRQHLPEFRQLRLTSFAPEVAVTAAAISSGAKFIAYANPAGLFVQVIATAETHTLELPEPGFQVSSISWFPDSAKLLVDGANPADDTPGLWIVPVIGTAKPTKVGPYPAGFVSPDGSRIALLENRTLTPQLFVMRSDGAEERALVTGAEGETFGGVGWAHDGEHLLFTRYQWNPQLRRNSGSIESFDLATRKATTILTGSDFAGDVVSSPDGRVVYSKMLGANPAASGGEIVETNTDSRTGKAIGQPLVIANWNAPVATLSISDDGKYIAFRDLLVQHSVYTGELEDAGKNLRNVRRLTFGLGREDFPRAWTPDSKAIFIDSNRNGNWEIFKQTFDEASDVSFVQGEDDQFAPRVSPDGNWLLYLDRPKNWHEPEPINLMRMPISGGLAQTVLTTSEFSEWGLRFECPQRAGMPCVLAQRQGKAIAFRQFDPVRGFEPYGKEVARHDYDQNAANWTIAPDGSQLAWIKWDAKEGRIHTVAVQGDGREIARPREHDVLIPGCSHLHSISWAPDGEGWFVVTQFPASWVLLYVDLRGKQCPLLRVASAYAPDLFPSPNGRYLAFSEQSFGSNIWLLEKANANR